MGSLFKENNLLHQDGWKRFKHIANCEGKFLDKISLFSMKKPLDNSYGFY
jgi:hypothetical protein